MHNMIVYIVFNDKQGVFYFTRQKDSQKLIKQEVYNYIEENPKLKKQVLKHKGIRSIKGVFFRWESARLIISNKLPIYISNTLIFIKGFMQYIDVVRALEKIAGRGLIGRVK